ncbi:GIN domain-containing protein [Salegentibacter chungangensis]|uniref:GIN domain-containing protein n=1 Tax=Salegentibacter chungangensis TaxID=1335724 RepID=A0ABW3NPC8_9FLAO
MKKILLFLFICMASLNLRGQEKIKGNRNVTSEKINLEHFSSIRVDGDFEVVISRDGRSRLEVIADDNLHKYIEKEVVDETLHIGTSREIRKSKALRLFISYEDRLEKILVSGGTKLESSEDLALEDFRLETKGDSRVYLTLKANSFTLINGDKAKAELNITAGEVYFQLNQSSDVEALVKAPEFKTDIYEKASAKIEGDIEEFELRADHSTKFDGENLICKNIKLLAEGRSDIKINAIETLEITAKGRSKTAIYNTPEIDLKEFTDEATLEKKEPDSGLF